ncbi:hypothetical protein ACFLX2_00615 [Candidatus Dependentiae bacterium]
MKNYLWLFFLVGAFLFIETSVQAADPLCEDCGEEFFDEFDLLVDDALESGALKKDMEFKELTTTQRVLAKVGMPFINLYTFIVLKYRAFKSWMANKCGRCDVSTESCG